MKQSQSNYAWRNVASDKQFAWYGENDNLAMASNEKAGDNAYGSSVCMRRERQ